MVITLLYDTYTGRTHKQTQGDLLYLSFMLTTIVSMCWCSAFVMTQLLSAANTQTVGELSEGVEDKC